MPKSTIFDVRHGGYPFHVLVAIGATDAEVTERVRKSYSVKLNPEQVNLLSDDPLGTGQTVFYAEQGVTVLRMSRWDGSTEAHAHLAHEVFHCVDFLFGRIGMALSAESREAYAYAIQHLTQQILDRLAKRKR